MEPPRARGVLILQSDSPRHPQGVRQIGAAQMNKAIPIFDSITRGTSGTIEWGTCQFCSGRITRAIGGNLAWWHLETKRISCVAAEPLATRSSGVENKK